MSNRRTDYALITGGSLGIGKCIARQLAGNGYNIVLVALPDEDLEKTKLELSSSFDVDVRSVGIDLTKNESAEEVYYWCNLNQLEVSILINNAGFGYSGRFDDYDLEFLDSLMKLNMVAMVNLTRLFVTDMKKLPACYILNVGSIASYYDSPFKAVYAASKKFVFSFSRAIRQEYLGTSISVSVLTPAGVMTNDDVKCAAEALGWSAKLISYTPEEVAEKAVKGMFNGRARIVPGIFNNIYIAMRRILPYRLQLMLISRHFKKKNVPIYKGEQSGVTEEVDADAGHEKPALMD